MFNTPKTSTSTSSFTVVMDSSLKPKEVPTTRTSLVNKLGLDLTSDPSLYHARYEYTDSLIPKGQTSHHLINAFLFAYNHHLPLKIRVDDIKLIIQNAIATCINNNPEKYRNLFVDHKGKVKISVESGVFNVNFFCETFTSLMKEKIKDPKFAEHFCQPFSTTSEIAHTVSNMALMNTLKEFFSCEMILGCGIPEVMMEGTKEDWLRLNADYQYLRTFMASSELAPWFKHFDLLMTMFVNMRSLEKVVASTSSTDSSSTTSRSVNASPDIKELWKRVISYVPQGSGSQTVLGGWVRLLIPYADGKRLIHGLDKPIQCLDITKPDPAAGAKGFLGYAMQDRLAEYYLAAGWSTVPTSVIDTPATLVDYDGTSYDVEFHSGFYPAHFDGRLVSVNQGYTMTENYTAKNEKEKAKFLEMGVRVEKYCVSIPESMKSDKKVIKRIQEIFGVGGCYSFHV